MAKQLDLEFFPPPLKAVHQRDASGWQTMLLLVVAALVASALHLDQRGDPQADERFYMASAVTMVESGDWLVPMYDNIARVQKFPLQYWLVAGSYKVFGVGVWQARLPSVAAGAITLMLTCWLGVLLFNSRRAGLYGSCALLSSAVFIQHAHWAVTDAPLALFTVAAYCGFAVILLRGQRWGAPLAWAAMACAVMQKTPLGALMPLGSVTLWMMLVGRQSGARWRSVFSPLGIALFLALVLPWPIALLVHLGREQVFGGVGNEWSHHIVLSPGHFSRGVLYYAAVFLQGILPWSFLYFFFRRRAAWTPPAAMLWSWAGLAALFSALVIHMLRVRYLLPELPALALLPGCALDRVQADREAETWAWRFIKWGVDGMLAGLAFLGLCLLPSAFGLVNTPASWLTPPAMMIVSIAALILTRRFRSRAPEKSGWVVTAAVGIALAHSILLFSWNAAIPPDPAWQLARRYLHGVPTTQITGVQLNTQELAWSWVAVGGSFRNETLPFREPPSTRYLLIDGERLDELGTDVLQRYTVIAKARGRQKLNWQMFWFVRGRADKLRRWEKSFQSALLLEYRSLTP